MRPLRLTLQAFGPFAGREHIDFSNLPPDALFLIHGPTGAGKTSILDGICYALYGETSGSERSAKEMRSHHASDDTPTEVEFEFELGDKRYRIRRSPEQERASLRGKRDQMVTTPAKAELQVCQEDAAAWSPLVGKTTEVTARVTALLGFEADQFRQVIMLPQGQFRRLLTAESKERERILEALFSTVAYKHLQERLNTAARELEQRGRTAMTRRSTLLEQAEAESETALNARAQNASELLAKLAEREKQCRADDIASSAALAAGEALAVQFAERESARVGLQKLDVNASIIENQRRCLDNALRAQLVVPAYSSHQEAAGRSRQLSDQVVAARREVEAAAKQVDAAATMVKVENGREGEREVEVRNVAHLEGLRERVLKLSEAQHAHAGRTREAEAAAAEHAAQSKRLEALNAERLRVQQTIDGAAPTAGRLEALRLGVSQLEQQVQSLRRLQQAEASLLARRSEEAALRKSWEEARARQLAANQRKEALEARWRIGQATVLARHLNAGSPCPVCGSREHPQPAHHDEKVPTEGELETSKTALAKAESEAETARSKHQALEKLVAGGVSAASALRSALPADLPDLQDAEKRLLASEQELSSAIEAARILDKAKGEVAACEQQIATANHALEQTRSKAEAAKIDAASAAARVQELAALVPEHLRKPEGLDEAIKTARGQLDALLDRLKSAQATHQAAATLLAAAQSKEKTLLESLQDAQAQATRTNEAFLTGLREHGFDDENAFLKAMLSGDELTAMRTGVQAHDEAVAAARERLARAEGCVDGRSPPDLNALKAAQQSARQAIETLVGERNGLTQKLDSDRRLLQALEDIRRELNDIESRFNVMGRLASVANGDNSKKLTFQRFVLAALLDDVLRQASLRLRAMSRGRYTLQRRDDVADARKASGLDLEVFDDYTGRARPASTLSGGEGFMAALSLALGLSDVVQAYAGGIQLDTLFIDEGFGSLDPESLDMAMKALIDLQQKGRMIGIISHVDELKRQIDVGIEVVLGATGSRVRVGIAGG